MSDINKAQKKLEEKLAGISAAFRFASVGQALGDDNKLCLEVGLVNELTAAEKKRAPTEVDGIKVRYTVTGMNYPLS